MPSKPSCSTVPWCRISGWLLTLLIDEAFRARRYPRVEPPLGDGDGELLAVPGKDFRVAVERQDLRADRAELARKVVEIALMRDWTAGGHDVAAEQHAKLVAVEPDRAWTVTGGMYYFQGDIGHFEDPALLHLNIRFCAFMCLPPGQLVGGMQRNRGLVALRHVERCRDVPGVPVRADHGENLALAHGFHDGVGRFAGIDHDHLVVVADHPRVNSAGDPVDPRLHRSLPSSRAGARPPPATIAAQKATPRPTDPISVPKIFPAESDVGADRSQALITCAPQARCTRASRSSSLVDSQPTRSAVSDP